LEYRPTTPERLMTADRTRFPKKVRDEILSNGCAYCGDFATCLDHVVPLSKGGPDDVENLAPACRLCNAEKLDFTPDEWRAWREARGMSWPPTGRRGLIEAYIQGLTSEEIDALDQMYRKMLNLT
jgi:hypothetical protein